MFSERECRLGSQVWLKITFWGELKLTNICQGFVTRGAAPEGLDQKLSVSFIVRQIVLGLWTAETQPRDFVYVSKTLKLVFSLNGAL